MNLWDILIILAVAAALFFAVRRVLRTRGACQCSGDCSRCGKAKAAKTK